jgi:hypothetical protein
MSQKVLLTVRLGEIPLAVFAAAKRTITGDPVFAGVMFYQGPVENERRLVRSHGPESIYKVVVEHLNR